MFNIISWKLFLIATTVLVAGYYLITSFAFYRNEVVAWIKSLNHPSPKNNSTIPVEEPSSANMMGLAHEMQSTSSIRSSEISSEDIITSGDDVEEDEEHKPSSTNENMLIGTVADLLEEIKTLIRLIAEQRMGKTESRDVFNALFIRYPHLQSTSYPLAISFYISDAAKDQFSFDLTPDEVMTWWKS